jgi:hypothetical protein
VILAGLDVNRRLTRQFIEVAPVTIELIPVAVAQSAGGRDEVMQTPRAPQVFTLLEPGDSGHRDKVTMVDGSQLTIEYLLLGEWDAQMADGDRFIHDGRKYKLVHVMPENGYERRAMVIRHGW